MKLVNLLNPPPLRYAWAVAAIVLAAFPSLSQVYQNPFWVLPANPPKMVRNGLTGSAQIGTLPFTNPSQPSPIGYPTFNDRVTAANGIFTNCANTVFYIAGDEVFSAQGISKGNLFLKDRFIKWNDPGDEFDNPDPHPDMTENFEAPVFRVPGSANAGKYYCVYSDCRPYGSNLYIATYNSNTQTLIQPNEEGPPQYSTINSQIRFAISRPVIDNLRDIFVVDRTNQIVRIRVSATGVIQNPIIIKSGNPQGSGEISSELELSHDGKTLAWAIHINAGGINSAIIHTYNLTTNTHTTFEIFPGACKKIASLEYLPDGRLAVAATWNAPLSHLDGILIFTSTFQGASTVSNSAPYRDAMIELGYGSGTLLYANNGVQIAAVNLASGAIDAALSIPQSSLGLTSPYASFSSSVSGALPDQIDGELYVNPSTCPGSGGNPPVNRMPVGSQTAPPDIDIWFTEPLIRTLP